MYTHLRNALDLEKGTLVSSLLIAEGAEEMGFDISRLSRTSPFDPAALTRMDTFLGAERAG